MEASFESRLDKTFGFLNGAVSDGDIRLWRVQERSVSKKSGKGSRGAEEPDSDDDEEEADFLKSERDKRRANHGERLNTSFFGLEDLEELESEDDDDVDEDDDDVKEHNRVVKRKKRGGNTPSKAEVIGSTSQMIGGPGSSDPSKPREEDDDDDDDVREVREMVGMDDTLDFEDEEDEYDRAAAGIVVGINDRLFMNQVWNYGANGQQLNPLPTSFTEMRQASHRDCRANHEAALARLEEDDREAATKESEIRQSNPGEDSSLVASLPVVQNDEVEAMVIDSDGHQDQAAAEARVEAPGELGTADSNNERKPKKRVRFSVGEVAGVELNAGRSDEQEPLQTVSVYLMSEDPVLSTRSADGPSTVATSTNRSSKVPDYVKNPSKYIHYTLDWSEEDEEHANLAAFQATRAVTSSAKDMVTSEQEDARVESQGPLASTKISFNPLVSKRSSKAPSKVMGNDSEGDTVDPLRGVPFNGVVNIAANLDMDGNLGGVITMEDDQVLSTLDDSTGQGKRGRVSRRYRNRVADDVGTD